MTTLQPLGGVVLEAAKASGTSARKRILLIMMIGLSLPDVSISRRTRLAHYIVVRE